MTVLPGSEAVKFQIRHDTRYQYDKPVYCEPQIVRLRPRNDFRQSLESFRLRIRPEPAGVAHFQDLFGNDVSRCWFNDLTSNLIVTTNSVIETHSINPFDFVIDGPATTLPLELAEPESAIWSYFTQPEHGGRAVAQLAQETLEESRGETVAFLCQLAARIHRECETIVRHEGMPFDPDTTWQQRYGACRDLAVLFNEVCREVGLPARFVSGYAYTELQQDERHLHAWSEVYLPGAGWRGFDPSIGLATGEHHVAVAAAMSPRDAAPTSGTFRGTGVKSTLETQVIIHADSIGTQCQSQGRAATELILE